MADTDLAIEATAGTAGRFSTAGRARAAVPGFGEAVLGAVGWGAAMAVSAQFALWLMFAGRTFHYADLSALYFTGGAVAWPLALWCIRFAALARPAEIWFGATAFFLSAMTVIVTGGLFVLVYRSFYAQWHGETFSLLWMLQFAFTSVSALYQFAVIGLRLYLPFGAIVLGIVALVMARRNGAAR